MDNRNHSADWWNPRHGIFIIATLGIIVGDGKLYYKFDYSTDPSNVKMSFVFEQIVVARENQTVSIVYEVTTKMNKGLFEMALNQAVAMAKVDTGLPFEWGFEPLAMIGVIAIPFLGLGLCYFAAFGVASISGSAIAALTKTVWAKLLAAIQAFFPYVYQQYLATA